MANITVDIKKKSIDIGSNLVAIGKGGMNPGVYDPQEIKADVFDMDNMVDGVDKHYLTTEQIEEFENKQDTLTAGDNITIDENNVISATDTTYTAGDNVSIENNVISAVDTTYTAGEGISIDENNVISNTQTSAEWGNIQGDIQDQEDLQQALGDKQDVLTAGENIDITNNVISATDTTYEACDFDIKDLSDVCGCKQEWSGKQDTLIAGDNIDITNNVISACGGTPNDAILTIQKNSCCIGTFTANASEDKTINITVPVTAADVNALPDSTKYGASVTMSIDSSTYVVTLTLKDQDGNTLGSTQTIDLPIESVVVSGSYDADTKEVVLVLKDGSEIRFSVADLVSGLQTEITVDNKLDADLVDDSTSTNKFVTASDKCNWDAKADICDIPTDNCQLGNGCGYTTCTGTLVANDIANLAQCCDIPTDNNQLANGCGYIKTGDCASLNGLEVSNNSYCVCIEPGCICTECLLYGTSVEPQAFKLIDYDECNIMCYTMRGIEGDWGCFLFDKRCEEAIAQMCDLPDTSCLAQCCDIPTDNCQLANSCGYTTCTGTLVQCDIQNLAQCCDIPTDNCQLANGCGYTTCTGDMEYSDFNFTTLTGNSVTLDLSSKITPTANFTINAPATIKDGQAYVLRVENGATTYTMTLGTNIINPNSVSLTLTPSAVDQFVFLGTDNKLELQDNMPDLSEYQLKSNMVCDLTNADNNHYPTAKAVSDAMACAGVGDMLKSVYDPCGCEADAFNACNMYNMPHIPTDNCELANSCGYTTCTGTLVQSDIQNLAQCCDIPTDNCQLVNGCGYTTCTGTLVASDLNCYAKCCDIPTDNCQLGNGCCYATCSYVNDGINSVTAYYITKDAQGNQFATYAELSAATTFYSGGVVRVPTRNDYTIVLADENHSNATTRYIYQNSQWEFQYVVNETALTQAQLDALNSGITCTKVNCYDGLVSTVSGYGDIVSCDACDFAIPSDIPTDNCQLANGCGYTTCTGTLVASDIACLAQCCDIPTDNCQLANGCGYITGINCSDVTSALGYTPYNSTNPAGYTSCIGTITELDVASSLRLGLVKLGDDTRLSLDNVQRPSDEKSRTYVVQNLVKAEQMAVNVPWTDTTYEACDFDIKDLTDSCSCRNTWNCKQDALTAGNGIDITNNVVSGKTMYIITEDMMTKSTTATKGVAPYNTDYYYTNITIDDTKGIKWEEGALYMFMWDSMTASSSYRNVRMRIGTSGDWKPFMSVGGTILNGNTFVAKGYVRPYMYTTRYQSDGAVQANYDANSTYTSMTQSEINTGTCTTCRLISAANLKYAVQHYDTCYCAGNGLCLDACNCFSVDNSVVALQCDIPTDNCDLSNGCGYTTCTGDMQYCDFNFATLSGASITLGLSSTITPSANFTVNAPSTIKDGQTYVLRVSSGATAYTMTLGTNVTNPSSVDLTLTPNTTDQFVFLGVGGKLELQKEGGSDSSITKASSAPNNPSDGDIWYNTSTFVYYTYSSDISEWLPLSDTDYDDYDYNVQPSTITLSHLHNNHDILLTGDGTTVTSIAYDEDPMVGSKHHIRVINKSTSNDALINLFGVQLVILKDNGDYAENNFLFTYNTIDQKFTIASGTMNLLSQDQYDGFTSDKETDGVFRWILEDE